MPSRASSSYEKLSMFEKTGEAGVVLVLARKIPQRPNMSLEIGYKHTYCSKKCLQFSRVINALCNMKV